MEGKQRKSKPSRPVAKGGRALAKPKCPPLERKKILHPRYSKKVNFRTNVLNFACVNSFNYELLIHSDARQAV